MLGRVLNILLALAIVLAASAGAYLLFRTRPRASQAAPDERALPVDVVVARHGRHAIRIHAMGEVKPAAEVLLQPQVSGKVLALSPNLVPGGQVAAEELLIRVDRRDYATMLAAQEAALEQARVRREEELSLKKVAEHEWQGAQISDEARNLALREPHLRSMAAQVQSAQSQLKKARRDLDRTVVRAPFDGVVLEEYVDLGQIVAPGVTVARIAGTRVFWVQVSVPVSQLARLDVPGINSAQTVGSRATVVMEPGPGLSVEREAHVGRLLGSVDPRGRMAQLLLVVEDPLQLTRGPADRSLPLLLGSYVDVVIEGRPIEGAVALPIEALEDEDRVWVVSDGLLHLRPVQVAWRESDRVLVAGGLEDGDRVVVSPVPTATEGMPASIQAQLADTPGDGPLAAAPGRAR